MAVQQMKLPDAQHPITIRPEPARIVARVGDEIVADTTSALALAESNYPVVYYIPLQDVDLAVLHRSTAHSHCPYKGDASYYSIVTREVELPDVVWAYEDPYPAVAAIADHVAFYTDRVNVGPAQAS